MKMKSVLGGVVAAAILSSATFAADQRAPLPAGKPAGAQQAALMGLSAGVLIGVGMAAVVLTAALGGFSETHAPSGTGPSAFVKP